MGIHLGWMAITVSALPHKTAGAALGQMVNIHHLPDRHALGLWG
jgi:hypothetical protein